MLRQVTKTLQARQQLVRLAQRSYYKDGGLMTRDYAAGYYSDPMDVGERIVRLFALHDACIEPSAVTMQKTFSECGLNALDMVELFLGAEREFNMEISEEDCEAMNTVNDLVEFLAKNPATQ